MEDHTEAARRYHEYEVNADYRQFERVNDDLVRSWRIHAPEIVAQYRQDLEELFDEGWPVSGFEIAIEDLEDAMLDESNERFRLAFLHVSDLLDGFNVIRRLGRGE
jgi:hypothetical protein